jgi:outer membrane receptor for ferrienterochelin and colicin
MQTLKKWVKIVFTISISTLLFLQSNKAISPTGAEPIEGSLASRKLKSLSGYIKDAKTGEALIGATVLIRELKKGVATNTYGFYSVSMMPGTYNVDFSYIGYTTVSRQINLTENSSLVIELSDETKLLNEVVVTAERSNDKLKKAEMSVQKLEMKTIRKIPALMGEVDVLKAIQMLPGVQATSEGTSGFSVRGGGNDQNLIILDEAPVYNASHLMGFFSVFNNDAVSNIKLYKGDIPAYYGGRLSSVLDVRMKEGNSKEFKATGGLGLISSRLTIEGPIKSEKTSFLISGRRTYADLFFPLFSNKDLQKSMLYFYDANLKVNHQLNENNRLYLSAYLGRDIFGQKDLSLGSFGNKTATLRWNHQYSSILFSNLTGIVSNYDYLMEMKMAGTDNVWRSKLFDYALKADFNLYPNPENEIKFGGSSTYHTINPCDAYSERDGKRQTFKIDDQYSFEHGIYASNSQKIGEKLTLKYGLRLAIFQNIGEATVDKYDASHNLVDSAKYKSGDIYNTYTGLEPRLGINYTLNDISSLKASFSRTNQFLQLASNSNGGMPLDYWFPASPNVKPQKADQYAIGYFRNIFDGSIETSIEAFYKSMDNVIDFRDHADMLFNPRLEGDIRTGKAQSYGLEFLIRKNEGRFNGWISYTLSRATRKIPEINDGKTYNATYDKPHNVNIIVNYEISKRVTASANWVYASGTPITFPVGSYKVGNNVVPVYSKRNEYRMRDYHRLDLSVTISEKERPGSLWQGEWVFSLYNVYGRHNDWIINFVNKDNNIENKVAQRMYLPFVFFPGITYNFVF